MTPSESLDFGALVSRFEVPFWGVGIFDGESVPSSAGSALIFLMGCVVGVRVLCDNLGFFMGLAAISDRAFALVPVGSEYVFAVMAAAFRLEDMLGIEVLKRRRGEGKEELDAGSNRLYVEGFRFNWC